MNYQVEIIKKIEEKLKEQKEFTDIINDFREILSKNQISREEYYQKLSELNNKYPMEMNIITARDTIIQQSGKSRNPSSYKEALIDILISITAIKYCEKKCKPYTIQDINSYDFILNVLNS